MVTIVGLAVIGGVVVFLHDRRNLQPIGGFTLLGGLFVGALIGGALGIMVSIAWEWASPKEWVITSQDKLVAMRTADTLRGNFFLGSGTIEGERYYYYFTELIRGKKEVYLSYVAEEKRDVASRFINLALSDTPKDRSTIKLARKAFGLRKRAVKKNPEMLKALYQYLQKDGLSPTALSDYRKCPYRYYLKYVLRITEPNRIIEEPGAKEWGEIIHKALRNFYQYHFPRGFTEKEKSQVTKVMETELENDASGV